MAAGADLEIVLRTRFDAGDFHGVATSAIEGYGREVRGYLAAVLRDDEQARDVFADTMVEIWRDLPRFRWEGSFRTWMYTLARHRLAAHLNRSDRQRTIPLSSAPEVDMLEAATCTLTTPWQRTDVRNGISRLRENLSTDDQTLLILRIDRKMSWRDIARVLGETTEATLRKRFERIKRRLRGLAARSFPSELGSARRALRTRRHDDTM